MTTNSSLSKEWNQALMSNDWDGIALLIPQALTNEPHLFFQKDPRGWTALQRACRQSSQLHMALRILEVMEPLQSLNPAAFKTEINDGLFIGAYSHDSPELARALIAAGAKVDYQKPEDTHKDTPLHKALRRTNWNYAMTLLESGARSDILNAHQHTALDTIGNSGIVDIARQIKGTEGPDVERRVRQQASSWLSGQEITQAALVRSSGQTSTRLDASSNKNSGSLVDDSNANSPGPHPNVGAEQVLAKIFERRPPSKDSGTDTAPSGPKA